MLAISKKVLKKMSVTKKPDLTDPVLKAKLAKGMGHNSYGEPAWPNDLLYIFPVVIFGTFACVVGLAVLDPAAIGEPANPFATSCAITPILLVLSNNEVKYTPLIWSNLSNALSIVIIFVFVVSSDIKDVKPS